MPQFFLDKDISFGLFATSLIFFISIGVTNDLSKLKKMQIFLQKLNLLNLSDPHKLKILLVVFLLIQELDYTLLELKLG